MTFTEPIHNILKDKINKQRNMQNRGQERNKGLLLPNGIKNSCLSSLQWEGEIILCYNSNN